MAHLTLRLPDETLKQVDELRERLEKQNGIPVNRADALRMLITKGIEQQLKEDARKG
ncbi:ribbon-helix-helix domain-containing protein [Stutzerimonas stutzeri]|uniref:ribbon-helix-helix domain-containing protein n=1 Tax=Stutzerimonas stutzeri TaxID=316 RepID=UPI001F48438C|nr:ribbon-helix-helix domain-containing protein [Stutzerimonas stutzeri]